MLKKVKKSEFKINKIGTTEDKISGRGGLAFYLRYVEQIGFYFLSENILGKQITIGAKGLGLYQFIKQILAYFIDGTYMRMESFNDKKKDRAYTSLLENKGNEMASSHQVKRFFRKLMVNKIGDKIYRKFLHKLFIWRLRIEKPKVIILGVDTMVMNNDDAKKREGVEPTYKKKKGYQPLHISWGAYLVDILFRSGSKHSNHEDDFTETVNDITKLIRKNYNREVPIIVVCDSGFLDDKAFRYFEENLKIGYIITGKMYKDIRDYIEKTSANNYKEFKGNGIWQYLEFGNKLKSWKKIRRTIFTRLTTEKNGQLVLDFARPNTILYTNIGQDSAITEQLINAGKEDLLTADSIITLAHKRGKDELIHRSIKELATKEQLPFKNMEMNRAYYFLLAISHFLFESYKRDVTYNVLSTESYPNTFRRKLIDFAVKIVYHSGEIILKVTSEINERLKIIELWRLCQTPPPIFR
ncbi:MAG: IS1380 family transposase [Melioribacteraceae bacterium]|nr:IS1380 family transposase [Melioribacteraceae bacterium]